MSQPSQPYRNEIQALYERRAALQAEMEKLREQTSQLDELRAREAAVAAELAGVEGRLAAGGAPKRALPLLDQVRVASPCSADWNEMVGDANVRFCLSCEKSVYNLSTLTRDDAETLLRDRLGSDLCIRFYERADGTILTQDCPVGVTKKRRKKLALAVAGAGAMAAAAATMFMKTTCKQGDVDFSRPVSGGAMYQGDITPVPPVAPIPTTIPTTDGVDDGSRRGQWVAGGVHPPPVDAPPVKRMGKPTLTMGKR